MKTMKTVAVLGMVMGMASLSNSAQASDWSLAFGFGGARGPVYAPRAERHWVAERYETRVEQVLVRAAHTDQVFVEPAYEKRTDHYGKVRRILVTPGYWKEVLCQAEYETRNVQVLIPGYWEEVRHTHHHRGWNGRDQAQVHFGYSDRHDHDRNRNDRNRNDRDFNNRRQDDRRQTQPEVRKPQFKAANFR